MLLRMYHEFHEFFSFLLRLIIDVCSRVRKPKSGVRRLAIVTRADIFPTNHGGAVKIVQTAKSLSFHYEEVLVITPAAGWYFVFRRGEMIREPCPSFAMVLFQVPQKWLQQKLNTTGFPPGDSFMALPVFDWNFKFRVLYLAVRRPFEVLHAEVAPYVFACDWASWLYPAIPRIVVEQNVEFLRIGATYNLSVADIEKMKQIEIAACRHSDRVVAVSEEDRTLLIDHGVEPWRLAVIPSGVDVAAFASSDSEAAKNVRQQFGLQQEDYVIIFHGVLSYKPNYEAVRLINQEIMPLLRAMGCPAKCLVVGLYPPVEFAAEDIIMTGAVDSLVPYIQAADVAIVPLLDGGGTRLKILEYFAAGVPVISTAKGAEGIKAEQGKDILIEDSMEGIADLVSTLQHDEARRRSIGANGKVFVQRFGWDRLAEDYCSLYREIDAEKLNGAK